jgi:hypothetical protein
MQERVPIVETSPEENANLNLHEFHELPFTKHLWPLPRKYFWSVNHFFKSTFKKENKSYWAHKKIIHIICNPKYAALLQNVEQFPP